MRALAAALALLVAAPGATQPAPSDPAAIPAEVLAPNDDARVLFEALSSNPMTDELLAAMFQAVPGDGFRPADDVIEQSLEPGELRVGWQDSGIDLIPVIAALEGGLAGNVAEGLGPFGPIRAYLVDGPFESIIEPTWVLVGRRGAPLSVDGIQTQVTHISMQIARISPKVILAERVAYRRHGNAYCRARTESRIYADPSIVASEFDSIAIVMTMRSLATLEQRDVCELTEDAGQGQYRTLVFDLEGHRLPGLELPHSFRIVPRTSPTGIR